MIDNQGEIQKTKPDAQRIGKVRKAYTPIRSFVKEQQEKFPTIPKKDIRHMIGKPVIKTAEDKDQEIEAIKTYSHTDSLTHLLNKEGFDDALSNSLELTIRSGRPMVLIFLDANNLKKINDEKGHKAGDQYLQTVASVLDEKTRFTDVAASVKGIGEKMENGSAARWGGDEFGVVLVFTDKEGAKKWWEKTDEKFRGDKISIAAGATIIDPRDVPEKRGERSEFISIIRKRADDALYAAKPDSKIEGAGNLLYFYDELTPEQLEARESSHH